MIFPSFRSSAGYWRSCAGLVIAIFWLLQVETAWAKLIGELVDVSQEFQDRDSTYFVAGPITKFDAKTGAGELTWQRHVRQSSLSFNKLDTPFVRGNSTEFPGTQYDRDPVLPFEISFIDARTVRLRFATRATPLKERQSLMLAGKLPKDDGWKMTEADGKVTYTSAAGRVEIVKDPWQIRFFDVDGAHRGGGAGGGGSGGTVVQTAFTPNCT